jgi:acetolactate synthase-1/2/3 large subunit
VAAGILGDAKDTLAQLTGMLEGRVRGYPGPEREVGKVRSSLHAELSARSKSAVRLVEDIQQALPEGAIIVNDITICAYWGSLLFSIREPRTYLYPAGFVTLGFGLPAAIGARVACPDRTVLAICGDGGFLYTATELATAVHHGVNVVVLLVNDNRFGILEPQQLNKYGRTSMIDLTNPDFVAFARSFGAYACAVDDMRDVGTAIRAAIAANRPAVVELKAKLPHPFDW